MKVNNEWKDEANFIDVEAWGNQAENLKKFSGRGKRVAVSGYLLQKKWEKDGVKHSKICIVANSIQFLTPRDQNGQNGNSGSPPAASASAPQQNGYQQSQNYPPNDDDLDIPF